MKIVNFIRLFMTAIVDAATSGTTLAPVVLTSDNLTKLQADYKTAWGVMVQFADPMSKEAKDAKLAVWKIENEMRAEEAAILKSQNDAKIAEARNARLALNTDMLALHTTLIGLKADKKTPADVLAAAELAFNTSKEKVDNELLAKYANSSTAKKSAPATDGAPATQSSTTDTAAIVEMYLAGKTQKEIEEAGYARSTVWHAINKYKIANNLK